MMSSAGLALLTTKYTSSAGLVWPAAAQQITSTQLQLVFLSFGHINCTLLWLFQWTSLQLLSSNYPGG
jgi:hypothetical protein